MQGVTVNHNNLSITLRAQIIGSSYLHASDSGVVVPSPGVGGFKNLVSVSVQTQVVISLAEACIAAQDKQFKSIFLLVAVATSSLI